MEQHIENKNRNQCIQLQIIKQIFNSNNVLEKHEIKHDKNSKPNPKGAKEI